MRLWVGGRAKGSEQRTAPAMSPAVETASPDQLESTQPPAVEHLLGLMSASEEEAAPSNAEWGFHDPDVAGFSALMATLDTSAIPPAEEVEENPGELLLRQDTPAVAPPVAAIAFDTLGDDRNPPRPSPAAAAVASCPVGHLAPLALWARLGKSEAPGSAPAAIDRVGWLLSRRGPRAAPPKDGELAGGDLAAAIGRPAHPAYLALTGLSAACRIHHVHIAPIVEVSEEPEERPSWPLPSVVSLPDTISLEPPPDPDDEPPEIAEALAVDGSREAQETTHAPANVAEEPPASLEHPQSVDATPLQEAIGADMVADVTGAAIEPPALDSLPADLMADLPSAADAADAEAVAFMSEEAPPFEPELWGATPSPADEAPAPQPVEALFFDDLATAESAVVERADDAEVGDLSRPEFHEGPVVPCAATDAVDHAEPSDGCDDLFAATVVTAVEVEPAINDGPAQAPDVLPAQAPAVLPIPVPVPAAHPVRTRRRRAALALG